MSCKSRRIWVTETELGHDSNVVSDVVAAFPLLDSLDKVISEVIFDGVGLRISGWSPRLEDGPPVLDDVLLVAVMAVMFDELQLFDEREGWRRVVQH